MNKMGWKKWPSWLKGGVIGVIIILVLSFIIGIFLMINGDTHIIRSLFFSFLLPGAIFIGVINFIRFGYETPDSSFLDYLFIVVISIALYFILGALIGWIVGKIRNR